MTHPIAQTLARGHSRRHGDCHLGLRTSSTRGEWLSIAALLGDDEHLQATFDRVGIEIGSARRDVQASIFLEAYAWRLVLPLAGALVAEQRVAAPTLYDIALRPGEGRPSELLLRPGRFSALRSDRAASQDDARPTDTPARLAEIFEATLISHFTLIVVALNRRCGRSTRALWRTIGDRTATALLNAGLACKDRHTGEQLAHQILRGTPPLDVTPTYARIVIDDRPVPVHLRRGCCLWWCTAAATYCATCPLGHRRDRALT